ncbi:hypothetical protein PRIPAC_74302, partial [Pristionchus pacificus]|uniref:Uncharacterized protein n=1 Tax=Pristionchus pacificus TaxID=54126 RepID=A0A2A6B5B7_PRIPA
IARFDACTACGPRRDRNASPIGPPLAHSRNGNVVVVSVEGQTQVRIARHGRELGAHNDEEDERRDLTGRSKINSLALSKDQRSTRSPQLESRLAKLALLKDDHRNWEHDHEDFAVPFRQEILEERVPRADENDRPEQNRALQPEINSPKVAGACMGATDLYCIVRARCSRVTACLLLDAEGGGRASGVRVIARAHYHCTTEINALTHLEEHEDRHEPVHAEDVLAAGMRALISVRVDVLLDDVHGEVDGHAVTANRTPNLISDLKTTPTVPVSVGVVVVAVVVDE